jgi:dynactin 1
MAEFKVGQTIETTDGRTGVIRFIGDIHVAAGQFMGIELPEPSGKNDGSVKGERYFNCPPEHGLFLRAAGISRIVSQPAPPKTAAPPKAAPRQSLAARAGSVKPRPSSVGMKPPPPPVAKPAAAPAKRMSMVGTANLRDPFNAKPPPGRKSSVSTMSTISGPSRAGATLSPTKESTPRFSRQSLKPTPTPSTSSAPTKASRDSNVDALETEIRHLKKQLAENRETIAALDQVKGDKARIENILQKVQAKCQSFHQENTDLKARQQELQAEYERLDKADQEHESIIELATLDREMAEEKQEQAEAELEQLRARLEERELELEILKSESEMLTEDMTDEDKHTTGYFQLQTERDRLRQALIRLKEMTEETEADLKGRIKELEKDQAQMEEVREQIKNLQTTSTTSEGIIRELREQLDAAEDWEEIIEDLSSQNQQYKDQLVEKDLVIQDLENLKELNDELEMHHMEQANDLRTELDVKEAEVADQTRKLTEQEASIVDQDTMITKFRDLVLDLQSKMTDAESSKTMSEEEAKDVTGRFNEMMEMNRRLRNATLTSTVKTITSELQKLQAEEAEEELEIVKHYLPDSPDIYKNDSLRAYFRANRISFKSSLTGSLMKSISLQSTSAKDPEQPLHDLMRLDAVHQLTYLHLKGGQFRSAVKSSTLEQFVTFGPVFEELAPVEKNLERCLDSLKSDELNFKDISESLRRSNQILQGVTVDYKEALEARPEDEVIFRVSSIKASLDLVKSTFDALQSTVRALGITEGDWDSVADVMDRLTKPSETSSSSIAVTVKLIRTLETLRNDSLYPRFPLGIEDLAHQDDFLGRTAQASQKFATELTRFLIDCKDDESTPIEVAEVSKRVSSLQGQYFPNNELDDMTEVIAKLREWNEYAAVLNNTVEIEHGPAPWVIKAKEIEAAKKQTADAEKKLQSLTVEYHSTMLLIRERDEVIDTKEVEIEHLKAKHKEAVTKVEDLDRLQKELKDVEEERAKFQQQVKAQQLELIRQKERALSERSEPVEVRAMTPSGDTPAAEKPVVEAQASGSFVTLMQALSSENHWLRQRENHEMFGNNLKAMFTTVRDSQIAQAKRDARRKQEKADEMLAMCLSLERTEMSAPPKHNKANEFSGFNFGTDVKSAPLMFNVPSTNNRRTPAPIMLTSLKMPLTWGYEDIEDLSFEDLSSVAEEFDGGVNMLEGYSEVGEAFGS